MSQAIKHIEMLGLKVEDRVTGFAGVVTCVSFDLYGCVQAVVTPPMAGKEGKQEDGRWHDVTRLKIVSETRVMDVPDFAKGYIAEGSKGPAEKPAGR